MNTKVYKSFWDKLSISASLACAIHCVILPIALIAMSATGIQELENVWLELAMFSVSILAGGWAVYNGYKRHHKNKWIPFGFLGGIAFMVIGNLDVVEGYEMAFKLCGALLLINAHLKNWRQCKICELCNTELSSK